MLFVKIYLACSVIFQEYPVKESQVPAMLQSFPLPFLQFFLLPMLLNLARNSKTVTGRFNPEGYTARELEVVKAVAEGLSNKEIAEKLFISEGTVKNYITSVLAKENLAHRTALAVYYP